MTRLDIAADVRVLLRRLRRDAQYEAWRLRGEARAELHPPRQWADDRAACAGCRGDITTDLCWSDCPLDVQLDCLAAAITEERHVEVKMRSGVRGGLPASARTTPLERRRNDDIVCGTVAGYRAHLRAGEPTCPACRRAHADEVKHTRPSRARQPVSGTFQPRKVRRRATA